MKEQQISRRSLFKIGVISITSLTSLSLLAKAACPLAPPVNAKTLKKLLKPDSKTAKRIKFVANASDSPIRKEDGKCGTCKFFTIKKEVEGYAPCSFASNKYVPKCGYCKQYKLDKKKIKA